MRGSTILNSWPPAMLTPGRGHSARGASAIPNWDARFCTLTCLKSRGIMTVSSEEVTVKRPNAARKTAKFSKSVSHQLNAYSLAAGAAGVSLLALAQPAEARIIYTTAHVKIVPNNQYDLDLNHDGINDFIIAAMGATQGSWLRCYPFAATG